MNIRSDFMIDDDMVRADFPPGCYFVSRRYLIEAAARIAMGLPESARMAHCAPRSVMASEASFLAGLEPAGVA